MQYIAKDLIMQEKNVTIANIFNRIKKFYNLKNDVQLAKFLDISHVAVSIGKTRNQTNLYNVIMKCQDMDLNYLLFGDDTSYKTLKDKEKNEKLDEDIEKLETENRHYDKIIEELNEQIKRQKMELDAAKLILKSYL